MCGLVGIYAPADSEESKRRFPPVFFPSSFDGIPLVLRRDRSLCFLAQAHSRTRLSHAHARARGAICKSWLRLRTSEWWKLVGFKSPSFPLPRRVELSESSDFKTIFPTVWHPRMGRIVGNEMCAKFFPSFPLVLACN